MVADTKVEAPQPVPTVDPTPTKWTRAGKPYTPAPLPPPKPVELPPPPIEPEPDPHAHRPHAPTGNLSTYTGPVATTPPTVRVGDREVPETWPGVFGPSAFRAMPGDAAAISRLCTKLRTNDLSPATVLATPADQWRFLPGIGGPRGDHVKLAELCTQAGWEPGCLAPDKPEREAPKVKRRRRDLEVIEEEGLTDAQARAWVANDCKRDDNDKPILLRSVGGAR